MEHVNGWCFRGIYKGGLWEDDLHVFALNWFRYYHGYHTLYLTGPAVITHDVTTGTGYCLVGFSWIIDFLN